MIKALLARLKEGCRTGAFPPAAPSLPPDFRGRPVIDADTTEDDVNEMKSVCPVEDALSFSGGVASNSMLRREMQRFGAVFAQPAYSTDNAMGVAVLAHRLQEV